VRRRERTYRVSSSKGSVSARANKYSLCSRTGGGTVNLIGYGRDQGGQTAGHRELWRLLKTC